MSNRAYHDRTEPVSRRLMTARDAAILGTLDYYNTGRYPGAYHWPGGDALVELVRGIVETGRARALDIHGPTLFWAEPQQCELAWTVDEAGAQRIEARDGAGSPMVLLPFPTPFFVDLQTGQIGVAQTALPGGVASWLVGAPPVPHGAIERVTSRLAWVEGKMPVPRFRRVEERTDIGPQPLLSLYGVELQALYGGGPGDVTPSTWPHARLEITYAGAGEVVRPGEGGSLRLLGEDAVILRHQEREAAFAERFRRAADPYRCDEGTSRRFHASSPYESHDDDVVFPRVRKEDEDADAGGLGFAIHVVPGLRAAGWRIEIDPSWPFPLHERQVAFSASLEETETDWFSLRLSLATEGGTFDVAPIVLQLVADLPVDRQGRLEEGFEVERHLAGKTFRVRLDDGSRVGLEASLFARFAEAFLEAQGVLEFHRSDAGRLLALAEALDGCGAPWSGRRELLDLGARLRALAATPEAEPPAALRGELRSYQRTGYGWLKALSESGFGGMLADDMGLGKTVQTLALLAHRHLEEKAERPSLLVVPTSLVGNWRREAARFAPDLKLLVLHGPARRQRFREIPDHDLVVTTYPLLNRDHEALFDRDYEVVVLDEAQAVKNPASAVAKRIREVRAQQRLALTGTPLENNLQELWALCDWLVPGLLGNRKKFTREFRRPIEKHGDRARQRLLSARVKPFLLRRTKEEVAPELPERTVIDETIPLEGAQAALYESIRTTMDTRVREAIAARGMTAAQMAILEALLRLRQVCCDPGLVKLDAARKVPNSAKRARLLALLEELVAEGRKVLVFSQFVEMLKLIERDVVARGWGYAMLHGSTKDRDGQVAAFQSGDRPLFLASLKAGGTGLNLTAADTVIVYDPWWNPAAERQAMDRAHRIGQDKPVFVHRLIAEDTVEAAIQRMQARKQGLADALFEGTGQGPLGLTEEDIDVLFAPVPTGSPSRPRTR